MQARICFAPPNDHSRVAFSRNLPASKLVTKGCDAVEKLFYGGLTVPSGDGKCLPCGWRSLIALLIASFFPAKLRARGKRSFSIASCGFHTPPLSRNTRGTCVLPS